MHSIYCARTHEARIDRTDYDVLRSQELAGRVSFLTYLAKFVYNPTIDNPTVEHDRCLHPHAVPRGSTRVENR